jgi:hypothetical protein
LTSCCKSMIISNCRIYNICVEGSLYPRGLALRRSSITLRRSSITQCSGRQSPWAAWLRVCTSTWIVSV